MRKPTLTLILALITLPAFAGQFINGQWVDNAGGSVTLTATAPLYITGTNATIDTAAFVGSDSPSFTGNASVEGSITVNNSLGGATNLYGETIIPQVWGEDSSSSYFEYAYPTQYTLINPTGQTPSSNSWHYQSDLIVGQSTNAPSDYAGVGDLYVGHNVYLQTNPQYGTSQGGYLFGNVIGTTVSTTNLNATYSYVNDPGGFMRVVPTGTVPNTYDFAAEASTNKVTTAYNVLDDGHGNIGIGTIRPNACLDVIKRGSNPTFMISSTTTLDGDTLMVDSSGNVGIGTWVPLEKVEIQGNLAVEYSPNTDALLVDTTGNVGIGTSFRPRAVLEVDGTVYLTQTTANIGIGTWLPQQKIQVIGGAAFSSNVGLGTTIPRAALEVDSTLYLTQTTGNIGIGTWLPKAKLDVIGSSVFSTNVGIGTSGATPRSMLEVDGTAYFTQTLGNIGIGTWLPVTRIQVAGTGLNAAFAGNVGIGTTAAGLGFVQVYTAGKTATAIQTDGNIGISTTPAFARVNIYSASASVPGIFSDGNIGIGTTNPKAGLEIGTGTKSFVLPANSALISGGVEIDGSLYVDTYIYSTNATFMPTTCVGYVCHAADGHFYCKASCP